jgi:hypothetical protein
MRRMFLCAISTVAVVACSGFGSNGDSDSPKTEPGLPPPSTPQDNATTAPPAVGGTAPEGLFVSFSKGADDGTGSAGRPLKTLKRAFDLAREKGLRVIACAEEFPEAVTLVDGVSAFGYYDCSQSPWVRVTKRAIIKSPTSPAVLAQSISMPTRIEGFEMRAPDLDGAPATDTDGTSIGLEVRASSNLTIAESLVHGGAGAPGTDGAAAPTNTRTNATSDGAAGKDETVRTCPPDAPLACLFYGVPGPAGGVSTCAIGPNGGAGGQGGDARWYNSGSESMGSWEPRGRPFAATADTAIGGVNQDPAGFGPGKGGTNGQPGAVGTNGGNGMWTLTSTGFVRGNGTAGGAGGPGQGGGGGAGTRASFDAAGNVIPPAQSGYWQTASGGSGGAGGCPGQAGGAGTGGAASIGALVVASTITIDRTRIESSSGGRAGAGSLGTAGTAGGLRGAGVFRGLFVTGNAGAGGNGGTGGTSGHGAPGPSIALVYGGNRPTTTSTDLAPGVGGAGQPPLAPLPAVVGLSEPEHLVP